MLFNNLYRVDWTNYVFVFLVVGRGGISWSGVGVSVVNRCGVSRPVVGIAGGSDGNEHGDNEELKRSQL